MQEQLQAPSRRRGGAAAAVQAGGAAAAASASGAAAPPPASSMPASSLGVVLASSWSLNRHFLDLGLGATSGTLNPLDVLIKGY
jgi:hypothetical protein